MTRKFKKRSKAEIRAWLKTSAGQAWLRRKMADKNGSKERKRRLRDDAEMARLGLHYDCKLCVHGIGEHCPGGRPDGCPYFLAAKLDEPQPQFDEADHPDPENAPQ